MGQVARGQFVYNHMVSSWQRRDPHQELAALQLRVFAAAAAALYSRSLPPPAVD